MAPVNTDDPAVNTEDPATFEWKGVRVPREVHVALNAPFRGQKFGSEAKALLGFFHETATLLESVASQQTCKQHVKTILVCRDDDSIRQTAAFDCINPSKLLPKVLASASVPEEVKFRLARHSAAKCSKEWMEKQHLAKRKSVSESCASASLAEMEKQVALGRGASAGGGASNASTTANLKR